MDFLYTNNPVSIFAAISIFLGTIIALVSVHEASHAWMANKLGDPTAKYQGRISLNPQVHIDPLGTVILPLFLIVTSVLTGGGLLLFGWAKPTPFNPWNLKNPRRDAALISFAGPVSNFAVAIIIALIIRVVSTSAPDLILVYLQFLLNLTLVLGIFNLIPIAPLDGFKVVAGILPRDLATRWEELERIGPFLLIFIIFFGGSILQPLISNILSFFLKILVG
ncbi:MAG: site-2 protease family protein [Candidatus Woykebacteria bacterium]